MNFGFQNLSARTSGAKSFQEADPERRLGIVEDLARQHPRNHWLQIEAALLCLRTGRTGEALRRLSKISLSEDIGTEVIGAFRTLITRAP